MATSIQTTFEAVKKQLKSVLDGLGEDDVSHELGEEHISDSDALPRIVWVVIGGPVGAARQAGANGVIDKREIARRNERCQIHIWGEDFGATEILMNHFVAAARELMTAFSFQVKGTDWTQGQANKNASGRLCILDVEISIPITAEPIGITKPSSVVIQPTMHAAG
jgi:hypothetical protein